MEEPRRRAPPVHPPLFLSLSDFLSVSPFPPPPPLSLSLSCCLSLPPVAPSVYRISRYMCITSLCSRNEWQQRSEDDLHHRCPVVGSVGAVAVLLWVSLTGTSRASYLLHTLACCWDVQPIHNPISFTCVYQGAKETRKKM